MTQRPSFIEAMARPLIAGAVRYRRRRRWRSAGLMMAVIGAAAVVGMLTLRGNGRPVVTVDVIGPHPTTTAETTPTPAPITPVKPDLPATTLPEPSSDAAVAKFHPVNIEGLPDRYIALDRDGNLSVVDTATGESTELYRVPVPVGADWRRMSSMTVDPAGEYVYVGYDGNRDCKGTITRVAIDGGEAVDVAEGLGPLVSPDGRWLFYTIDGATHRGEVPPDTTDPTLPCRGRHDSYAWLDLTTGTERRWIAPPLGEFMDPVDLYGTTFEPGSHRLYLAAWSIYTAFSVITPDSIGSVEAPGAFSGAGEGFDSMLISGLSFLPDGSLLITGSLPDVGLPPGARIFQPPDGYDAGPVDVSQPWWLISGYHGRYPGDRAGPMGTWVWNQVDDPTLMAENVSVRWLP